MEKIRPMLFTTLKKYSGAQLMSDVVAGIIVAIIALPLSIALALFFGAADRINQIETREETKCLVLRMRAVPAVDSTAMNSMVALYERCQKNGVTLILSHVNEQPMHVMEKAGFVDMVGRDHFCPNIEAALDHADEVLGK